MIFNEKPSCR